MTPRQNHRRAFLQLLLAATVAPARAVASQDKSTGDGGITLDARTGAYHVSPNGQIQEALEAASRDPINKIVYVRAGTYRPRARGQALIWSNLPSITLV